MSAESAFHRVVVNLNAGGVSFDGTGNIDAGPGTVTGDTLPEYCAVVCRKYTAVPGKEGRGRWYFGCIPEIFTDNGLLLGTTDELYQTLAEQLSSTFTANDYGFESQHHSPKNNTLTPILTVSTNQVLGTLRRRRLR